MKKYMRCLIVTDENQDRIVTLYKNIWDYMENYADENKTSIMNIYTIDGCGLFIIGAYFDNKKDYNTFMKIYSKETVTFDEYHEKRKRII